MCGIEWAAGLFCGEGTWGKHKRGYSYISLGMRDEAAVHRFAEILTPYMPEKVYNYKTRSRDVSVTCDSAGMYRVHLSGRRAEAAHQAMLPFLTSAKGGQ